MCRPIPARRYMRQLNKQKAEPLALHSKSLCRGTDFVRPPLVIMATRKMEHMDTVRRREAIKEVQRAIGRELRDEMQPSASLPRRIADLVRELHKRLRQPKNLR
jgi:hypothetical protein